MLTRRARMVTMVNDNTHDFRDCRGDFGVSYTSDDFVATDERFSFFSAAPIDGSIRDSMRFNRSCCLGSILYLFTANCLTQSNDGIVSGLTKRRSWL